MKAPSKSSGGGGGKLVIANAKSEGSGETVHAHSLTRAFPVRKSNPKLDVNYV